MVNLADYHRVRTQILFDGNFRNNDDGNLDWTD